MTSVRILLSGQPDGDVAAHLATIGGLPRVETFEEDPIRENALPLILASAFRMLRDRPVECPMITSGEAALSAASIAWRGPIIHLPVAPLSDFEAALLRRVRPTPSRLVVSSYTDARRAVTRGVPSAAVHVIRPIPIPSAIGRAEARATLGLRDDEPAILVPGVVRNGSGHRLGTWAAGILSTRDVNVRVIVRSDPAGAIDRFAATVTQPPARVATRGLDDAALAAAADVAILTAEQAPQLAPIAAIAAAGTPIVATRKLWTREKLASIPAVLVDDPKSRLIARAALEVLDVRRRAVPMTAFDAVASRHAWIGLFNEICRPAVHAIGG